MKVEDRGRKSQEAAFHNQLERDRISMVGVEFEKRYTNKKWYSVVLETRLCIRQWLNQHCRDRQVLDYCCGVGQVSLMMAEAGAYVTSIDISGDSVNSCKVALAQGGYGSRHRAFVMDAENTTFDSGSFDGVVCIGVLHHLDLDRAYSEIRRILKPGGAVLCVEALGHNPVFQLYRRLTPRLRTAWETEHILKCGDVQKARRYFGLVHVKYYYILTPIAALFRNTPLFKPLRAILAGVDRLLLSVPGMHWLAWQVVFELREPIPQDDAS